MISGGLKIKENCHVLVNQFHGNFHSKAPVVIILYIMSTMDSLWEIWPDASCVCV